jgi:hypothetical protein
MAFEAREEVGGIWYVHIYFVSYTSDHGITGFQPLRTP